MTHTVTTVWKGQMKFESDNLSGNNLIIDVGEEEGGSGAGYRPKSMMLSSLAGCSGLDVASLLKKMRVKVKDFNIVVNGELTEEHPKYYHSVSLDYHFYGDALNEEKINKAVELSIEKYCGVMAMFKSFAEIKTAIYIHSV
ncbi:MAG: OsmC family protein [Flavobacteriaceae bacterium]|nr:OsmC family protein [Flavobacteriaceae bacterium]